jgi:hypothetical protein
MQIFIHGRNLPGRDFRHAAVPIHNVHVAVQVGDQPEGLVRADAESAEWHVDVRVERTGHGLDFKGPAVHGKRGERFLYLTWGEVDAGGGFTMFRRAKLMLDAVDPALVSAAVDGGKPLHATIVLTDDRGGPRCARVDPPALTWS